MISDADIITRVRQKCTNDPRQGGDADLQAAQLQEKLTDDSLRRSIARLGFAPPQLYVDLMQTVGNGGFGPSYGFLGLEDGATDDLGKTAVDLYCDWHGDPNNGPNFGWPAGLLPICHWGCAIYSCIACLDDKPIIKTWDPNVWDDSQPATAAILTTEMTLSDMLVAWLEGNDLWEAVISAN